MVSEADDSARKQKYMFAFNRSSGKNYPPPKKKNELKVLSELISIRMDILYDRRIRLLCCVIKGVMNSAYMFERNCHHPVVSSSYKVHTIHKARENIIWRKNRANKSCTCGLALNEKLYMYKFFILISFFFRHVF